jgi:hypothetical protein
MMEEAREMLSGEVKRMRRSTWRAWVRAFEESKSKAEQRAHFIPFHPLIHDPAFLGDGLGHWS